MENLRQRYERIYQIAREYDVLFLKPKLFLRPESENSFHFYYQEHFLPNLFASDALDFCLYDEGDSDRLMAAATTPDLTPQIRNTANYLIEVYNRYGIWDDMYGRQNILILPAKPSNPNVRLVIATSSVFKSSVGLNLESIGSTGQFIYELHDHLLQHTGTGLNPIVEPSPRT